MLKVSGLKNTLDDAKEAAEASAEGPTPCTVCGGKGEVQFPSPTTGGAFKKLPCTACGATGRVQGGGSGEAPSPETSQHDPKKTVGREGEW